MAIPDANIIITGFMATGKTTIGRWLARRLDRRFVDADEVIVERAEMSIAQLFATQGEAGFRTLEKEVCRDLAAERGLVVATGGGMLVDADNLAAMMESGLVVCLDATPDAIRARLALSTGRPLAGDWESLLEKRRAAYTAIPVHVDTTDKTPDQTVEEIITLWHESR